MISLSRSPSLRAARGAPLVSALLAAAPVHAQSTPGSSAPTSIPVQRLPEVVVTGNPLRQADVIGPVDVLAGDGLVLRRASTLGETLNGQPGVSSSWFGPNANRPVLRGLDGDRVRLLSNAGSTFDASSLSFDHAVPIDPLVLERIEVLRGPSALLYGGNAIGGVVNSIDNRIPRRPLDGLGGRVELRANTGAAERSGAAVLEGGSVVAPGSSLAWHADLSGRQTGDLHVPRFTPAGDGETPAPAPTERLPNSAARVSGGALGLAWHGSGGHFGLSADQYRNTYGVVVEPDVSIRMRREGLAAAGEWRAPFAGAALARFRLDHTRYQHEEVEGSGAVGTTFRHRGSAGRLEIEHRPLAGWHGLVGAQFEQSRFSALGEEAFVPSTHTRQQALFLVEERALGAAPPEAAGGGRVSAGLRAERVHVGSAGDAADAAAPRFGGPLERRFPLLSASLGGLWRLGAGWQAQAALSHSERAPTHYELYANGLHLATAAFERGDAALARERGRNLDLALVWKSPEAQLRLGAWASRFSNYLVLAGTGESVGVADEGGGIRDVPVYAFRGVPARLSGLEASGRKTWILGGARVVLDGKVDAVRGSDRASGEPLPRLAPWRTRWGLAWAEGAWMLRAELDHAARQSRVPSDDTATPAYTLVNLAATWRLAAGAADTLLFAKLDNLADTLATNAASIRSVRELAPLPGRSLTLGLQSRF